MQRRSMTDADQEEAINATVIDRRYN